jgi:hypothetical protein
VPVWVRVVLCVFGLMFADDFSVLVKDDESGRAAREVQSQRDVLVVRNSPRLLFRLSSDQIRNSRYKFVHSGVVTSLLPMSVRRSFQKVAFPSRQIVAPFE